MTTETDELEDALTELSVLREKIATVLYYIREEPNCARAQTIIYIANDYLREMSEMIQVILLDMIKAPQ